MAKRAEHKFEGGENHKSDGQHHDETKKIENEALGEEDGFQNDGEKLDAELEAEILGENGVDEKAKVSDGLKKNLKNISGT